MKNIRMLVVGLAALVAIAALAQRYHDWRDHDPSAFVSVKGKVLEVNGQRRGSDVHLLIRFGRRDVAVELGPYWYMNSHDMLIDRGDTIKVKGLDVGTKRLPDIVAAWVQKGFKMVHLRDEKTGKPQWGRETDRGRDWDRE